MALPAAVTPLLPLLLWGAYLSFLHSGGWQRNYGWDWLTLEAGFLVIFLYPLGSRLNATDSGAPVIFLLRLLAFRLLFGAGMSKLGGSSSACWLQLSCTQTHYFTQPMPNPLAWFAHMLPDAFHRIEVHRHPRAPAHAPAPPTSTHSQPPPFPFRRCF